MFDKTAEKLAKLMGRSVKKAAEPIRESTRQAVDNKVDLWSRILRFGVLLFLFIDGTKRVTDIHQSDSGIPAHITINNYMSERDPKGR